MPLNSLQIMVLGLRLTGELDWEVKREENQR